MEIRETGSPNQPEKPEGPKSIRPELISRKTPDPAQEKQLLTKKEDNTPSPLSNLRPEKLLKDEEKLMKAILNKDKVNIGFINTMISKLDGN